jgi:hypothetical protein
MGVIDNVTASNLSVHSPVSISSSRIGFAPSRSWVNFHAIQASGRRAATKISVFCHEIRNPDLTCRRPRAGAATSATPA